MCAASYEVKVLSFKNTGTVDLNTDRLLLRRFNYSDIGSMLNNWVADPVIQHSYGEPTYESVDSVRELLNLWIPQYRSDMFYRWALIHKGIGENIGQIAFCCVYTEMAAAEIEYCIGKPHWGNGYAAEALSEILKYSFEKSQFDKLEAFHRIENPNSGRVLEKARMKKVSNVTRFEINNELPGRRVCYALTRAEYPGRGV